MKTCSRCKEQKSIDLFKQRKNGKIDSWCKQCYQKTSSVYYSKNKKVISAQRKTEKHKKQKSEWDKNYRSKHSCSLNEKKRAYYWENRDKHLITMRENYQKNPQAYKNRASKWKTENREKHNALCMDRYTTKMKSQLSWAKELTDLVTKEAYDKANRLQQLTNINYDVDHIVPLKSKIVSGLHIYSNLQVLPASQNRSKKNRHWPNQWQ